MGEVKQGFDTSMSTIAVVIALTVGFLVHHLANIVGIWTGPNIVQHGIMDSDQWGQLPQLRLCHGNLIGNDFPVMWAFTGSWVHHKSWDVDNPEAQPRLIPLESQVIPYHNGSCLEFNTAKFRPQWRSGPMTNDDNTINLWVMMTMPPQGPNFFNLEVQAVDVAGTVSLLGWTGTPALAASTDLIGVDYFEIEKTIVHPESGGPKNTYGSIQRQLSRHSPQSPKGGTWKPEWNKLPTSPFGNQVSTILDPSSPELSLVYLVFAVRKRDVAVITHISRFWQTCQALTSAGGLITVLLLALPTLLLARKGPGSPTSRQESDVLLDGAGGAFSRSAVENAGCE